MNGSTEHPNLFLNTLDRAVSFGLSAVAFTLSLGAPIRRYRYVAESTHEEGRPNRKRLSAIPLIIFEGTPHKPKRIN